MDLSFLEKNWTRHAQGNIQEEISAWDSSVVTKELIDKVYGVKTEIVEMKGTKYVMVQ